MLPDILASLHRLGDLKNTSSVIAQSPWQTWPLLCPGSTNVMSGRVWHMYNNLRTNIWYLSLFTGSPDWAVSFWFWSIGVYAARHPSNPTSFRRSKVYFHQDSTIPLADLATSMPRKYLGRPRSLTSKALPKHSFSLAISSLSSNVIIISSTYTASIMIFPYLCI